ncbi:uncharacterized protein GGS22DRAFT_186423 [Annulohypoxylon maeteangense]|uniref:uncharacterized protein n=1 Tax=Annulohypoxylon maeteangense TaxID=1927788 RepID=UPI0020073E05|nr:uncharacterized protein GGS22DRAFT_186423 [Annulohypoxylon maeteangense]KAI0887589.1 hypothetical protein GGS22DRAFT_186423 [Annulohypoxylon maeteangense]
MSSKRRHEDVSESSDSNTPTKRSRLLNHSNVDGDISPNLQNPSTSNEAAEPESESEPKETEPAAVTATALINAQLGQVEFENAMITSYDIKDHLGRAWDCAFGMYVPTQDMRTLPLVSPRFGDGFMRTTFGDKYANDMYSARNGLAFPYPVKQALEAGALVIVPAIPNKPSYADVEAWENARPRDYKFRVTKPEIESFTRQHYHVFEIASLDNRKLTFRNNFRPRTRFLYFLFMMTMFRRAKGAGPSDNDLFRLLVAHQDKLAHEYWGVEEASTKNDIWGDLLSDSPLDLTKVDHVRTLLRTPIWTMVRGKYVYVGEDELEQEEVE